MPGIGLGTAVVPACPRHPAVLARQALTAALAAGPGRLTLGIGLSHQVVIEDMHGYAFGRPARHMREYLPVLLPLLDGTAVSVDGGTLSARTGLPVPGAGRRHGAVDDRARHRPRLRGPGDPGRGQCRGPAPPAGGGLPVCVTGDPAARASAGRASASYGQLPSCRAMLDREGAAGPGDAAIAGDQDAAAAQLAGLAGAGVTGFTAAQFAPGPDREPTRNLLKTVTAAG